MPKLPSDGFQIQVQKDGVTVASLKLPLFCVEHMKKMDGKSNLDMMLKHINSSLPKNTEKATKILQHGKILQTLQWDAICNNNISFEIQ